MKYVESSTDGGALYERMLLMNILTELRDIKKEQKTQGKDIARLQVRTGIIASTFGMLSGLAVVGVKTVIAKVTGG